MEHKPRVCPNCARAISPRDTLVFDRGRPTHFDCKQPGAVSPEERFFMFAYCRTHDVAECRACVTRFRLRDLALDPISGRIQLCPWCRRDLTDSVRSHIYDCTLVPEDVRRRAHVVREMALRLVKATHEVRDDEDVLVREAEAALHALRNMMRQTPSHGDDHR